jgi:hypothetical protein
MEEKTLRAALATAPWSGIGIAPLCPPTAEQEHRVYGEKLKDTESE